MAVVLAGCLTFTVPAPMHAQQEEPAREETRRQLEERKRDLEATRAQEELLRRDVSELARQRAQLNEQLIATARRVQESEAKLSEIETRLAQLSAQEQQLRASLTSRRASIAKLLSSMQRIGREPPPALIARRDDALKMVRSAMLLAALFPELRFQAETLASDLNDLVRLGDEIRAEREAQQAETATLEEEQQQLAGLLEEKKAQLALSERELARISAAAKRHAQEVEYLDDLLKRMNAEFARSQSNLEAYEKELAARRLREQQARNRPPVVLKPEEKKTAFLSPGRIKPAVPFAQARKLLPRPVRGEAVIRFGEEEAQGQPSQGEWIKTRKNATVVSPADGWIVYAGEFRSYGQLLIINAGGGYHVLLAGMERIDVSVGQFVLAGEPVAVMGGSSSAGGPRRADDRPAMYIEFRKDGRPIDPSPWWADTPTKVQG
ncbi:MAG: peptidoglycan DD-metalloendopeptidase family protein [Methyloligellaceae bacterium]